MFKRILMNAVIDPRGNGAIAGAAADVQAEPDAPQAQGAAAATSPDPVAALAAQVSALSKQLNSLHAANRRAGEVQQPAPKAKSTTSTAVADNASSLLALRDAFDDATSELSLTKGQRSLLREHVMSRKDMHPGDVDSLVSDYVTRAGWTATAAAPAAQQATVTPAAHVAAPAPAPQNQAPVSSRGAVPAPSIALEEQDLVTMSDGDRQAFLKKHGARAYVNKLNEQLKGRQVKFR